MTIYIVEGIDKIGKTTALNKVKTLLGFQGKIVHLCSDFDTDLGQNIKRIFTHDYIDNSTRLGLVRAAREDFTVKTLCHLDINNEIILLDRYVFSTLVYQLNSEIVPNEELSPEANAYFLLKHCIKVIFCAVKEIKPIQCDSLFEQEYRTLATQDKFREVFQKLKVDYIEIPVEDFVSPQMITNAILESENDSSNF